MPAPTSLTDKRLIKATGNYETRDELADACKAFRQVGLSHKQIAEQTGVAACTVTRILSGDKKTYTEPPSPAPLLVARTGNVYQLDQKWPAAAVPEEFYNDIEHRLGQPTRMR